MNPLKVFSGITLIFFGLVLYSLSKIPAENFSYGGVILIGPIPVAFGNSSGIMVIAIFIALLLFAISMVRRW